MSNAQVRDLCGVKKEVNVIIDRSVLHWFGHIERNIVKRIYAGKCMGSSPVGLMRRRWIDELNNCLRSSSLDVR